MSKILIVSIFFGLLWDEPDSKVVSCEAFSVKAEVTIESSVSKVKILTERGQAPMKYILYRYSGELISKEWSRNAIDGLNRGKYYCTVVDAKNCRRTVEFEIF